METEYNSLAELRSELTADDPDERANAYGSVMGQDVQVSQVLGTDPDEVALRDLRAAGVIPEESSSAGRSKAERDEEVVELLVEVRDLLVDIEANTGGA